ncbi:CYFA0S04e06986g1_1 [Cyberlindnera fabianii]|uniref:NADH-cytochrome b5 reductase n=1 Tax=Cyberlindnera fabianii TaxID=36022 RepID=A0A061AZT7_CYBFA|nr:Plasma membrane-associated coenzyme Q6 reductase PGA3 [Cyberlindnera fabianii]CDR40269.1 CYFA0S04e06986g1_1 [Cyberlindnera fabianii]
MKMSEVEDKRELLKDPVHGIYIPVTLVIVGTLIMGYQWLPYVLALLIPFLTFRLYDAYRHKSTLHTEKWNELELLDKTIVSRNCAIYRFGLYRETETLSRPVGHHVACQVNDKIRYYTPISSKFDKGFFDIIVKSYVDGDVSKEFASMYKGQKVKFRGPVGRFNYATNMAKEIGIVAGGSGITPILQVLEEIATTPEDVTKVSLIYANETENDILLKEELDELAAAYPNFDVHYTLTSPPEGWAGDTGYVTKEMVEAYLPKASDDSRILVCGPQGLNKLMIDITEELGFQKAKMPSKGDDQVFIF